MVPGRQELQRRSGSLTTNNKLRLFWAVLVATAVVFYLVAMRFR